MFTEGETEDLYLQFWYRLHRERVVVVTGKSHGDPLTLVRNAVDARAFYDREAKRKRGAGFDEYWCMFDVDEHKTLDEALKVANLEGIRTALSNPCLELWFVLHAQPQTAYIHRADIQKKSKTLYGFEKSPTPDDLEPLRSSYPPAKARAQALDIWHEGNVSPPQSNPSTSVWEIVETIIK